MLLAACNTVATDQNDSYAIEIKSTSKILSRLLSESVQDSRKRDDKFYLAIYK